MQGLHTPQTIAVRTAAANAKLSKHLNVFEPVNVRLLKNIKGDSRAKKGNLVQLEMTPHGDIRLGFFSNWGGLIIKQDAVEGVDFEFI